MVSCTVSRPGSVTTLMRAKAQGANKSRQRNVFMSEARRFVALDVEAVVAEGDDGLLVAGRLLRQREVILDRERVLLLKFVRAFRQLPVAGNVFDDNEIDGVLLEVLDLDFDFLVG